MIKDLELGEPDEYIKEVRKWINNGGTRLKQQKKRKPNINVENDTDNGPGPSKRENNKK
jgi:hypothetical protein